jgi:hypothetical protein
VASYQQPPALPVARIGLPERVGVGDQRPVVVALAFRAGSGGKSLPGPFRQTSGENISPDRSGSGRDLAITADPQHVADPAGFQLGAQGRVGAIDLVPGNPPGSDTSVERPQDHPRGQRGLGQELDVDGDPGLVEAIRVGGPGLWEVELNAAS